MRPIRSSLPVLFTVAGIAAAGSAQALSINPYYMAADSSAQMGQGDIARSQNRLMLGTFHERHGDQSLLSGAGLASSTWMRVLGEDFSRSSADRFGAKYEGDTLGFQAGLDVFAHDWGNGHRDHFGLFAGYARTHGTTDDMRTISIPSIPGMPGGYALSVKNHVRQDLESTSFGGYWTHTGPGNWYLDTVVMGSWGETEVSSDQGRTNSDTTAFTASIEAGYPIALGGSLTLEPQAQLVAQHTDFDPVRAPDGYNYATYDAASSVSGRLGLRLQGRFDAGSVAVVPYAVASLWHDFSGKDNLTLLSTDVSNKFGGTNLETRIGLAVQVSQNAMLHADVGYLTDVSGNDEQRSTRGTIGARFSW